MEKIVNYNAKEINDMGKYLKDAFGAEEFFIGRCAFLRVKKRFVVTSNLILVNRLNAT